MALHSRRELEVLLSNKEQMYNEMSTQAAKKFAALQDQFDSLSQALAFLIIFPKTKSYQLFLLYVVLRGTDLQGKAQL